MSLAKPASWWFSSQPLQFHDQPRDAGIFAFEARSQQAQPVIFHRHRARLQLQQPVAIDRMVHQPAAIDFFGLHHVDQRLEARAGLVGIAEHAALVFKVALATSQPCPR